MNYFIDGLKRFNDFEGRTRRRAYWMFMLFFLLFGIITATIDTIFNINFLSVIYGIVMIAPTLSIGARRLHDTTRSGWWQLISIIPYLGVPLLIIILLLDSHDINDYGVNPKASEAAT